MHKEAHITTNYLGETSRMLLFIILMIYVEAITLVWASTLVRATVLLWAAILSWTITVTQNQIASEGDQ